MDMGHLRGLWRKWTTFRCCNSSGSKEFTVIALVLNFAAFFFIRASHSGVTFYAYTYLFDPFNFPLSLMLSDSSYFTLECHRTAGRVRFSCVIVCDDAFYSYYSVSAMIVLF
jgi:hypothetical protein